MRALRAYAPNDPSRLVCEEAPVPELRPGDVMVRVQASGVTPTELSWPTTWLAPDNSKRPLPIVPGHELSGVVEAVSPDASGLRPGDAVFGLIDFQRDGADAELVAVRATELAPKPVTIDHIHAASVPLSALTAWQAMLEHGRVEAGQVVLVHGAAGGVGSYAVQLARWRGARVIGTASATHAELLRHLGVDEVIDYHTTHFEQVVHDVDVAFDTVGGETWLRSWAVLRPGGTLVSVAVPRPPDIAPEDGKRAIWFVVRQDRDQLIEIAALIDAGHLQTIVDRVLPLSRGAEAYDSGPHRGGVGKTVIDVANGHTPAPTAVED